MDNSKSSLRRQYLQQRRELPPELWRDWSDRICIQLQDYPEFNRSNTILAYQTCNQEPDLSYLFTHSHKQWGLPRCFGKHLTWHRWQPSEPLIKGAYGILEPSAELPLLEPNHVDLILVPAVAIDKSGYRLGYGGGYYDRLFIDPAWENIPKIGIVFSFAYIETLSIDPWDISLDLVCTEITTPTRLAEI